MANEIFSYTPAQLQEAEQMVDHFLNGRNHQLEESRNAVLRLAEAMRSEGDPTSKVFRVGSIRNGMIESISYDLIFALEQAETHFYGRKATVGLYKDTMRTEEHTQSDLHESFVESMNSPELSLMENYVEIDIGQRAARNSADQQNFDVIERIA